MSFIKRHGLFFAITFAIVLIIVISPFFLIRHTNINPTHNEYSDTMWEILRTPSTNGEMIRTPVPHGWIVTYDRIGTSIVYVPDENHEWKIK